MVINIQIIQVRICSIIEGNAFLGRAPSRIVQISKLVRFLLTILSRHACPDRPAKTLWISNGSPTLMRQAIAHSATLTLLLRSSSSSESQTTLQQRSNTQHPLALAMKLILPPPCLHIHNPWRLRPLVPLVHEPPPATAI